MVTLGELTAEFAAQYPTLRVPLVRRAVQRAHAAVELVALDDEVALVMRALIRAECQALLTGSDERIRVSPVTVHRRRAHAD